MTTMTTRSAKRSRFREAILSRDPYAVQAIFQTSLVVSQQQQQHSSSDASTVPPPPLVRSAGGGLSENFQDSEGTEWGVVLKAWLDTLEAAEAGHALQAYDHQSTLHGVFNQVFSNSAGNWLVPALHAVCKSTHRLALQADAQNAAVQDDHAKLQAAVTLLQESFSRTFNDRKELNISTPFGPDGSKKAGVLTIVNELFAIYFSLNTLRLCKNLLRPVERLKLHEQGPMGELVTYRYYTGRLHLFEDQYGQAEKCLEFAFANCHRDAVRNKRRILRDLVPVKLYRGRLPSATLLNKYGLDEYAPLVDSMRKGDMRGFTDTLVRHQGKFIRQGTYLLLEKCKTICYRNLFKRVHHVLNKSQIGLAYVSHVFKWLNMPMDLDEIECILANLIYRGYVRGYLSHTKRVLVLSKRDPFPVTSVIAK